MIFTIQDRYFPAQHSLFGFAKESTPCFL